MSWSLFVTKCAALTGMTHVSRVQYAETMASAYHECVMRHYDSMTGMGQAVGLDAKYPIVFSGFLNTCEQNLGSHREVNWLRQVGTFIVRYWDGVTIMGPTGFVVVSNTGVWLAPNLYQNYDFRIILYSFVATARIHLTTLSGTYTSTVVPGLTSPWAGGSLQTTP